MNHSPTEGAQGSANSKTPLALPQQLEAFAAQFNGETRDMLLLAAQSLSRRDNYHTSLTSVQRQLAQSEERVAKMEEALPELSRFIGILRAHCDSPLRDAIRWDVLTARCDEQQKSIAAILSSSKTN